jgi:signal transduction histidine kinase
MATSPDYLRLPADPPALANTALDSLRQAVVVVDARHTHFPVVLANAAARRCLIPLFGPSSLPESSLQRWMGAVSVTTVEGLLAETAETRSPASSFLEWQLIGGDTAIMTEIKPLSAAPGQRLVMLTFAPTASVGSALLLAVEHMPLAALVLDSDLKVTYANAMARESDAAPAGGLLGVSALWLTPTSSLQLDVYARALQGCAFHTDALEVRSSGGPSRWFEVDVQPVNGPAGHGGLVVTSHEVTGRKRLEHEVVEVSRRERLSIGRDLHDGLGQQLTGVALMLRGLVGRVQKHLPEAVDAVNEIAGAVGHSIESTRSLARGLLPLRAGGSDLAVALRELAARCRELYGLKVSVRAEPAADPPLDDVDATHLYCIAQEALTNAARHAHATRVDIALSGAGKGVLLRISDDGVGIQPSESSYTGMGLNIMKYRAGMVGARLEIASREPRGTVVRVVGSSR